MSFSLVLVSELLETALQVRKGCVLLCTLMTNIFNQFVAAFLVGMEVQVNF